MITRVPKIITRRDMLYGLGATLGTVAFNAMLRAEEKSTEKRPLTPKAPHYQVPAKHCIFLYLEGGPSHIDTFDPKPKLTKLDGKQFKSSGKQLSAMASGKRRYVGTPFEFEQHGESGLWLCNRFDHLSKVADELCVYRGCQAESINHPTANLHMNTGNRFGGDPGIGAWAGYGLGTINQDLPGFVVLPDVYFPQAGSSNWSNGFLPAHYQATPLRPKGSPILDLERPQHMTREMERKNLDLLAELEKSHRARHPEHEVLEARFDSYELAFRMQANVPGLIDIENEPERVRDAYGIGKRGFDDGFARRCLLARKLVEAGVRFVQAYSVGWDSHDDLKRAHGSRIRTVDQPIAALIRDLKERSLLDETLIVACGEFGRSPDNGSNRGRVGRDHNATAMSVLFAGAGVRKGQAIGATDEIGHRAVEVVHPIKDLHVTILRLLGLDDNKLTFYHGGRFKQLSQTGGEVIEELIA
ncbi:MAG: DUF1501 domain-containing protein [Planctomycetota bacterium]